MLGKTTQKLIIVCDEKTESYANYLRQLISTNDDKDGQVIGVEDGAVNVVVWLEKDYLANKAQISSNEHILFVGDSKTSKSEASSMIIKFDKYGMKYGWLGKRAVMVVDNEMLEENEYNQFFDFCMGYETEFERIAMDKPRLKEIVDKFNMEKKDEVAETGSSGRGDNTVSENKTKKKSFGALGIAGAAVAGAVCGLGAIIPAVGVTAAYGVSTGINNMQLHKKVKDQQYRALTVILYIDGLREFLEA